MGSVMTSAAPRPPWLRVISGGRCAPSETKFAVASPRELSVETVLNSTDLTMYGYRHRPGAPWGYRDFLPDEPLGA
jgi:hypothetical protein